jgi:HlyD family secretion protein
MHASRLASAVVLLYASTAAAQYPANVAVAPVISRQNAEVGHSFVGSVHPVRRSIIGSSLDGRVTEFLVNAGDRVTARQPLAKLLSRQIEIQIAAAEAELKLKQEELRELKNGARPEEKRESTARVAGAQAAYDYMQQKLQRTKALFERKALSENELQDDVSKALVAAQMFEAAKAANDLVIAGPRPERIAQAEARVMIAEEEVNRLKDLLIKHTVFAPYDGFVVSEHTEVGQWIKSGELVAVVEDLAEVEVEAQVLENYLDHVRVGAKARVEIPSLPNELLVGTVATVVPRGDERSRNFPVKVRLKNKFDDQGTPHIKSGMFAKVWLAVEHRATATLIPQDAIVFGGQSPMVYVKEPDTDPKNPGGFVAKPVPVSLGTAFDGFIETTSQIPVGTEVVVEGNERLFPGQKLIIVPPSGNKKAAAASPAPTSPNPAPLPPATPSTAAPDPTPAR